MYQKIVKVLSRFFSQDQIFKHGFNLSPRYKRSVGRVINVSEDIHAVKVEIPLNYKNRNYVGAIFGGSMFAATDPIYMIQLIQILGDEYVVWDKAATIRYKRPAKEKIYAVFQFSKKEIEQIKERVSLEKEVDIVKRLDLVNAKNDVFAELEKTIYISSKEHYKKKLKARGRK